MNMNKKKNLIILFLILILGLFSLNVYAKTTTTSVVYVGDNFCSENSVKKLLQMGGNILIIAKVAVPLIIVIIGTFDLYKAIIGKDEKDLTKQVKVLGLRVFLGVFIFFIPTITQMIFDIYYQNSSSTVNNKVCIDCLLSPDECDVE